LRTSQIGLQKAGVSCGKKVVFSREGKRAFINAGNEEILTEKMAWARALRTESGGIRRILSECAKRTRVSSDKRGGCPARAAVAEGELNTETGPCWNEEQSTATS